MFYLGFNLIFNVTLPYTCFTVNTKFTTRFEADYNTSGILSGVIPKISKHVTNNHITYCTLK